MNVYEELACYRKLVGNENAEIVNGEVCISLEGVKRMIMENPETSLDEKISQIEKFEAATGVSLR